MEKWRIFILCAVFMLLIIYGLWLATKWNRHPRSRSTFNSIQPQTAEELL